MGTIALNSAALRDTLETMAALAGLRIDPGAIFTKELRAEIANNNKELTEVSIYFDSECFLSLIRFNNPKLTEKWFYHYYPRDTRNQEWCRVEPECWEEAAGLFNSLFNALLTSSVVAA